MIRLFFILSILSFCTSAGLAEEPWVAISSHPVFETGIRPVNAADSRSTAKIVACGWLIFYQQWLSVLITSECRMQPSCSAFSVQCIEKHGVLAGIVMTADRLTHEGNEQKSNRIVATAGIAYCPDPVSNNDFWWHAHE